MTSHRFLAMTLGALAGCASSPGMEAGALPPEVTAPTTPTAAAVHVDENLAHLRALQVFEVGALVVESPREAFSCYGPCPGAEAAVAHARETAAERLARFTAAAEAAAAHPPETPAPGACERQAIDANLAALRALRVVEVGALVTVQPRNDQQCYGIPCPAEVQAAAQATCAHAAALAGLVAATRTL